MKDASSCKHYRRLKELEEKAQGGQRLTKEEQHEYEEKKLHKALAQTQRGTYLLIKATLAEGGYSKGTILVAQDFTQLETTKGGFSQDLIIVWYHYDEIQKEIIRHTSHYVAGEQEKGKKFKADVRFVVAVWKMLLQTDWADVTTIIVFSDGCSRQWKLTKFSLFLMQLSSSQCSLMIDYHFFASCHGYGVYDIVGAQAQRTINHYEIDTKAAIIMPQQLAEILNQTSNHFASQ